MNENAVRIRPMTMADVPAVVAIEEASFTARWEKTAYERELQKNAAARYIVATHDAGEGERLIGFAGLWMLLDEAHVVTVGVDPGERRRGNGSMLVRGLLGLALELGASVATLECRESNEQARRLYRRLGFLEVGRRVHYYADNGEDAIIMTTGELDDPAYRERLERAAASSGARGRG